MPSRRTHHKSRHGCIECKARKVKCDETRPHCLRCSNRKTPCHYSEPFRSSQDTWSTPAAASPVSSIPTPPSDGSPCQFQRIFSDQSLGTTSSVPLVPANQSEQIASRNWDMELLHHYSTSTYLTFARTDKVEDLWQTKIPKIAFSHPFLLHGLLALSACHLSFLHSNEEENLQYSNLAKQHYNSALSLFRPMLNNIDKNSATPIVAFSMLVTLLSMGLPPEANQPATASSYIEYTINMLLLVKGIRHVLDQTFPHLNDSILMPALQLDRALGTEPLGFEAEVALRSIEARIKNEITLPSLRADYAEAVKVLRECNPHRADNNERQAILLAWAAIISSNFFEEMKERKPIAMAILGFYGTFLHEIRDVWWVGDKGRKIVESVVEVLGSVRGWENVIVWAKMNVGIPCDYTPLS